MYAGIACGPQGAISLAAAFAFPSPLPEIAILRLHHVHLAELWNWWKSRRPRNSESQLCVSSRNVRRAKGSVGRAARSYCDADDEGTAASLPADRRRAQAGFARSGALRGM